MVQMIGKVMDIKKVAELMLNGDMIGVDDNNGELLAVIFVKKEGK